mmetsp:Transcript_76799/g.242730  ORF Transcript_76799/g.242730 Transcript_76799/m.242730 type:complete len:265 (-) Transcript_76799:10-804(-)
MRMCVSLSCGSLRGPIICLMSRRAATLAPSYRMSRGTSMGSQGSGEALFKSHGNAELPPSPPLCTTSGAPAVRDQTLRRPSSVTHTRRCCASSAHSRLALPHRQLRSLQRLIVRTLSRASGWSTRGVSTAVSSPSPAHLLTMTELPMESNQCPRTSLANRSLPKEERSASGVRSLRDARSPSCAPSVVTMRPATAHLGTSETPSPQPHPLDWYGIRQRQLCRKPRRRIRARASALNCTLRNLEQPPRTCLVGAGWATSLTQAAP